MYCKNCGKELIGTPEVCPSCGINPIAASSYCSNCGGAITASTERCVQCGAKVTGIPSHSRKNKTVSVLLAIFLGPWTWLYTYKKDKWKFWTVLGISFVMLLSNVLLIRAHLGLIWLGSLASLISFGTWIWPVLDVILKNDEWYRNY